jgi:hypothetical protein
MPLGAAHRLAPEALFLDPDPAADAADLKAALDRLAGFSPGISAETDPARHGFGRVEVQLDGLERLWGPERQAVRRIDEALADILPGPPLAGIGGTRFAAAVAAAVAGKAESGGAAGAAAGGAAGGKRGSGAASGAAAPAPTGAAAPAPTGAAAPAPTGAAAPAPTGATAPAPTGAPAPAPTGAPAPPAALHVIDSGGDAAFLAPLPAAMLSRDPEVRARLARFGLRVIGQVAELPRSAVVARFGAEGEWLHARARGEETDPFRPHHAPERMAMALPIDPPVSDVEGLRFVLHRLAAAFGDQLEARGAATSRARLTLELDRSFAVGDVPASMVIDQLLPEPTSEGLAIERLLIARLETAPPRAAVARVDLELGDVAPAAGTQLSLFTPQTGRTGRLGWQLARLGLRFGEERVGWMELEDSEATLAEARWTWRRAPSAR